MEDSLPYLLHQTRNAKNPDRSTGRSTEVWGDGERRRTVPLFSSFLCLQRTRTQRRRATASATRRRAGLTTISLSLGDGRRTARRTVGGDLSLSLSSLFSLLLFLLLGFWFYWWVGSTHPVVLLMDGSHLSACFFSFISNFKFEGIFVQN